MFQPTDDLIKDSFAQLGIESGFFPVYEKEAMKTYEELQKDEPDEETTKYEDSIVCFSLKQARDFVLCYAKEIKKGHCDKWADAYARSYALDGNAKDVSAEDALKNINDTEERNRELEIHANSINEDPVFKERYKILLSDDNQDALQLAEKYTLVYHSCIDDGKSTNYAHAYAYASYNYDWNWCWDKYAKTYEVAVQNGKDARDAHYFAEYCVNAIFQGIFAMQDEFGKLYKDDWQREFYLQLMCEESKEVHKVSLSDAEVEGYRKKFC